MSIERRRVMTAYGAELELTPCAEGMNGAIRKASEIVAATPGAWMPQQFENPAGASLAAVAQNLREIPAGSRVLTFSYDTGERYLSVDGLFS